MSKTKDTSSWIIIISLVGAFIGCVIVGYAMACFLIMTGFYKVLGL